MNSLLKFLRPTQSHRLRHFSAAAAASPEEYLKRNYAQNISEYNTVITSITTQRRYFLLRDVYDDMMLDGVQPVRDTFHSLIVGTMKGSRLQDAFFFRDQMKSMGLLPDVTLYNFLISTCGKCKNSDQAVQILEEMKNYEVKPSGQTYVALLNASAMDGRLDRVYAIVRDMTAAGVALNKFCYAGLITAHVNKTPRAADTSTKIIEFVERSKGWSPEAPGGNAESFMMNVSEEELYNLPTADYVHRRQFLSKPLTVYHVAFHACAELRNVLVMETLLDMLSKDEKTPDTFITMQIMRCYLYSGDIDRGNQVFEDYKNSGKPPVIELYVTLTEGAMVGYTPKGMKLAQDTLMAMSERNYSLSLKMGSDLLLKAAGEKTGYYTVANLIWDLMQVRKLTPQLPAVQAYYNGLKQRDIPDDDSRLQSVSRILNNLRSRAQGPRTGPRQQQQQQQQ